MPPLPFTFQLLIFGAALVGAITAGYVWRHKKTGRPLVCPLGSNCERVVHSRFSRLFGWPVELLGLGYYGFLLLFYGSALLFPGWWPPVAYALMTAVTTAAFAMSTYLLRVQLVRLREWCVWCLLSALCSTIIFLAAAGWWVA
jgi:uncharacterized membrane protein